MNDHHTGDLFNWTPPPTYPERPGWRDPITSRDAAQKMQPRAAGLRDTVLRLLRAYPAGLTVHEGAEFAGVTVPAIQPRFSELKQMGAIKRSGERRRNKSGMSAAVWVIK